MELSLKEEVLPEVLLSHFKIVSFEKLGDVSTKKMFLEITLDELNELPRGFDSADYESKGFGPPTRVQDFPLRGKAVYLQIRRRKWRHKQTKKEIKNDYSFIAVGSMLTQELADFLKGTGRFPRRYNS